jgi:hypothetical protein
VEEYKGTIFIVMPPVYMETEPPEISPLFFGHGALQELQAGI